MIDEKTLFQLAKEISLPLSSEEATYYQERLEHFLPYIAVVESAEEAND